ncbi:MAG: type IV toxin-antitoxin system AbiEi family antitoxin [Vicinamibacteraceae bacterium]
MQPARDRGHPYALLALKTAKRTFRFAVEAKRTFLDRALTNAVIAEHSTVLRQRRVPLLLIARYIPRPTGERLANAGVNFVDRPGNIHLALGADHHVLLLGRREATTETTGRRPSPALVQLGFVLLADAAAITWPVRTLARATGIGKTAAATGLQHLVRIEILGRARDQTSRILDRQRLVDHFVNGYAQVLRPHLAIGRFRGPETDADRFVTEVARAVKQMEVTWAMSCGPAAYVLDRFYRGHEFPFFVNSFPRALQQALRLMPDRQGPITVLRAFGSNWLWRVTDATPVANPWLVYAELLQQSDSRALEAAQQIRERYLQP